MEDAHIESSRGDSADTPERNPADVPGDSGYTTTKVAGEALGVNPRTVRAYIERGDLEAKVEGEGIRKTYLVSIDSLYALRGRRGGPRRTHAEIREKSAETSSAGARGGISKGIPGDELAAMVRDLTADLLRRTADAAELSTRLELTAQAESTLREALERERERADRLEAELREVRKSQPGTPADAETAAEGADRGEVSQEPQGAAQRRSWLYKFFFGPGDS